MTPPLIKRFLIAFNEHKRLSSFIFALIVGAAIVFAVQAKSQQQGRTYKAVGTLSFRNPPPILTTTGQQLQIQKRISVNQDLLRERRVSETVRNSLNIDNNELLKIYKQIKITFSDREQADPQQEQLITIEYEGNVNRTQSKVILRTFMDAMIEYSHWLNNSQFREKIVALENKLSLVQKDLTTAEGAFYRYISNEGSDLLAVQDGSLLKGITNAQVQQREIKVALDEINGQIDSIVEQLGLTPKQAYTSSVLSADPVIANLRAQILESEAQIEQLQKDLRPEHPSMVQLRNQKEANEKLLQQRAKELIGEDAISTNLSEYIRKESSLDLARQELANQLVELETQKEGLTKQLESLRKTEQELRKEYEQFPDKQLQQAQLLQAVESQRILYKTISAALTDARAAEAETVSSLVITQEPFIERKNPIIELFTNPLLIITGGVGLGLLAVGGLIFLIATLDDRLHTPQELRETLKVSNLPILGQIPIISSFESSQFQTSILKDTDSPFLAFYERVRSNIRRYGTESSKVILLTSINHQEGKSITAYNLALVSAQAGKRTLLVEADLRSPSMAKVFNLETSVEAKTEPLRYYASRGDCINLVPKQENLYLLPSPGPQSQAVSILESSELQRLLRDARGRFDLVIIDTPCLSSCNDALLLEPLIDAMILIIRPGITQKSMINETVEQFVEGELPLLGAVINYVEGFDPSSQLQIEGYLEEYEDLETNAITSIKGFYL